jgi:hypothetical protein
VGGGPALDAAPAGVGPAVSSSDLFAAVVAEPQPDGAPYLIMKGNG